MVQKTQVEEVDSLAEESEWLEHVYGARDSDGIRLAYDTCAENYDAESISNGCRVPTLGAAFLHGTFTEVRAFF